MEDKIEVGEFVRVATKIGRVVSIKEKNKTWKYIVKFKDRATHVAEFSIKKHSKNLIDLIEPGDYVNGFLVSEIAEHGVLVCRANGFHGGFSVPFAQYDEDIRDIVTKQQFEQMKYKVEEWEDE